MNIDYRFRSKFEEEVGPLTFAMFLRVARNVLGMTQEQLGKKIGISRANVCDIEKGRQLVSVELAIKIAKKSGLSEKIALKACLQDQVRRAGSEVKVAIS